MKEFRVIVFTKLNSAKTNVFICPHVAHWFYLHSTTGKYIAVTPGTYALLFLNMVFTDVNSDSLEKGTLSGKEVQPKINIRFQGRGTVQVCTGGCPKLPRQVFCLLFPLAYQSLG